MELKDWYRQNFEKDLTGRYITLNHISPLLEKYKMHFKITEVGFSERGKAIPLIKIGDGNKAILAWSQMHGNEGTTTKAIFDFLKFIKSSKLYPEKIDTFLKEYSFYILPILNPDGAENYTRENANGKDLNRDAAALTQKESKVLRDLFNELNPCLCLNLHDQRSIYGFEDGNPAVISFLSPAADKDRNATPSRIVAMNHIVRMNNFLQQYIPGQVGRYYDTFNAACVGDSFQQAGVTTILFEAGHYKQDYNREKTREYVFYALLSLFNFMDEIPKESNYLEYFEIPENLQNYKDIVLRNVAYGDIEENISVAIQYSEVLENDKVLFKPVVFAIDDLENNFGYLEIDMKGETILLNFSERFKIGTEISQLTDKNEQNILTFR